jgi:hypothetical protein
MNWLQFFTVLIDGRFRRVSKARWIRGPFRFNRQVVRAGDFELAEAYWIRSIRSNTLDRWRFPEKAKKGLLRSSDIPGASEEDKVIGNEAARMGSNHSRQHCRRNHEGRESLSREQPPQHSVGYNGEGTAPAAQAADFVRRQKMESAACQALEIICRGVAPSAR